MQYFEPYIFNPDDQALARSIKPHITSADKAAEAIDACFSHNITSGLRQPLPAKIGVLLSGGVDSSLLAAYLNRHVRASNLYGLTVFAHESDSDVRPAQKLSKHFHNVWVGCRITPSFLDKHFAQAITLPHAGLYVGMANLALIRALEECRKRNISELWIGNGIDMMFGGGVQPKQFAHSKRNTQAFHKDFWHYSMQLLVNRFYRLGYPEMTTLSQYYKVRIVLPFANLPTIQCARSIQAPILFKGSHDKYPVRLLAQRMGVPKNIAFRAKQPLQESSGLFDMLTAQMYIELPDLVNDGVSTPFTIAALRHDPTVALRLYVALKRAAIDRR